MRHTFRLPILGQRSPAAVFKVLALLSLALATLLLGLGAHHVSLCTAGAPNGYPPLAVATAPFAALLLISLLTLSQASLPGRLALDKRFHPPRV